MMTATGCVAGHAKNPSGVSVLAAVLMAAFFCSTVPGAGLAAEGIPAGRNTVAEESIDPGRIGRGPVEHLYVRPAVDAPVIRGVARKDPYTILKKKGGWCIVALPDGTAGWTSGIPFAGESETAESLDAGAAAVSGDRMTLRVDVGRVREKPSPEAGIVHRLHKGETVAVVTTRDGWHLIQYADGGLGWAHQDLFAAGSPPPASDETTAREIRKIEFAASPDGSEAVSFLLSGSDPPEIMSVTERVPRVVCDFFGAHLGIGVDRHPEISGRLVRQVRIGIHRGKRPKIRVVLELARANTYEIRPVFYADANRYTLVVIKTK